MAVSSSSRPRAVATGLSALLLVAAVGVAALLSLAVGSRGIPFHEVVSALVGGADSDNATPADAALQAGLRAVVREMLDELTPREAKVLRMRFGIDMASDHTLEEVGKHFDVTRERIRQIESKAMKKLKHPSRADRLMTYLRDA